MPIFNPVPGVPGPTGTSGQDGDPGEDSLIPGPQGIQGPTGSTGSTGAAGAIGSPGSDGLDGEDGLTVVGPQGDRGLQGVPGISGEDGLDGQDGIPGPVGPTGVTGPQGVPGTGLIAEDGIDGDFIPGAQGIQGPTGPQGIPGTGLVPEDGLEGDIGPPGVAGPIGTTGAIGSTGAIGAQGPPGLDGDPGEDSQIVPSFIPGPQGISGPPGIDGDSINYDDIPPINMPFDCPLEQIPRILDQNLAILPNNSVVLVGPYTINSGNKLTIGSSGRFQIEGGGGSSSNYVNPSLTYKTTGTATLSSTSNQDLMAGFAQYITPIATGTVLVIFSGTINVVPAGGTSVDYRYGLKYGTGTAPKFGDLITGTSLGNTQDASIASVSSYQMPFCIAAIAQNLTLNTTYWFDLTFTKNTGTSITIQGFQQGSNLSLVELSFR